MLGDSRTREIGELEGIEFSLDAGGILANATQLFDFFETSPYATYAPFDEVRIFNDSSSKIRVAVNQRRDKWHYIAGKTEKAIKGVKMFTLLMEELSSAAISAGEIRISAVKSGITADTLAKRVARKFGGLI